jgi:hypothetical protein
VTENQTIESEPVYAARDLRAAVQDARKRLEAKAIAATTNDADGAYMDAVKCLDQILADHPSAPQPVVDRDVWFEPLTALLRRRLELSAEYPTSIAEDADEITNAVMELINGQYLNKA